MTAVTPAAAAKKLGFMRIASYLPLAADWRHGGHGRVSGEQAKARFYADCVVFASSGRLAARATMKFDILPRLKPWEYVKAWETGEAWRPVGAVA